MKSSKPNSNTRRITSSLLDQDVLNTELRPERLLVSVSPSESFSSSITFLPGDSLDYRVTSGFLEVRQRRSAVTKLSVLRSGRSSSMPSSSSFLLLLAFCLLLLLSSGSETNCDDKHLSPWAWCCAPAEEWSVDLWSGISSGRWQVDSPGDKHQHKFINLLMLILEHAEGYFLRPVAPNCTFPSETSQPGLKARRKSLFEVCKWGLSVQTCLLTPV